MPNHPRAIRHDQLKFDLTNPRAAGQEFESENEVVRYLVERSDVNELVSSILSVGWIEFEPLIVQSTDHVVLEGNRRLAALRLITDQAKRDAVGYRLPQIDNPIQPPDEINVLEVADRNEARAFIAFKHINGPAKWDAMAKARYAEEWYAQENNLIKVSRAIGDTHNTVLRLINGWRVYQQALMSGFDPKDITARRFNFSHLYTALSRPAVRRYLLISENVSTVLPRNPAGDVEPLLKLMIWMYGQDSSGRQHVIRSQNPDLGRLVRVLDHPQALANFELTGNLSASYEIVEPASHRFAEALSLAGTSAERTLGLISYFDSSSQAGLITSIGSLANTVRVLRDEMVKKAAGVGEL